MAQHVRTLTIPRLCAPRSRTQFECWLAFQRVTLDGLTPAKDDVTRCELMPVLNGDQVFCDALKKMWQGKSPQEAHAVLKREDIDVTNKMDKELCLPKLLNLNKDVKELLAKQPSSQPSSPMTRVASATVASPANALSC